MSICDGLLENVNEIRTVRGVDDKTMKSFAKVFNSMGSSLSTLKRLNQSAIKDNKVRTELEKIFKSAQKIADLLEISEFN